MRIYALLLILIFTIPSGFAQGSGQVPDNVEYNALVAFYNSTNGVQWATKTNWLTGSTSADFATWYGVTVENGDVVGITLTSNNLSGSIPSAIGNLSALKVFHVYGNQLGGSIPVEIGNLVNLKNIWASSNRLSGSIPSQVGNLVLLEALALSDNQLSGSIPASLGNLNKLISLNLNGNQLTDTIPGQLGALSSLVTLDLKNNRLNGALPKQLGTLTNLQVLHVYNNQLTGSIPAEIGHLGNLKNLWASSNQLSGSIPSEIGDLTNLEALAVSDNQLSGSIPVSIGNLNKLISLNLSGNQLTGALPSSIGSLTALVTLDLKNNQLSDAIPLQIGSLANLQVLHLYNNHLSGSLPSTMVNLVSLKNLWLSSNQLSGPIPAAIGNLTNLEALAINDNAISGSIPASIGSLTKLASFEMGNNQLTGFIPPAIESLSLLQKFTVNNNQLTGPIPQGLSDLQNLVFNSNAFTFSDFLPVKQNFSGSSFGYAPQDLIDQEKTVRAPTGGTLTLTTSIDLNTTPPSVYQWFKVVNGTTTQLNTASTDGHTITIQNIAQVDAGAQFYYKITNASAPDLTLTSKLQTLQIVTCTTPTLDFQFAEINGTHTFTPALTGENCTATYAWDFGDGTTSSEQTAVHSYLSTGAFNVKLTVSYSCNGCPAGELIKEHQVTIEGGLCGSIYCDGIGGVGIGTRKTDGFRLSVNGRIRASDIIKVYPQGQWSDFVFEKDYRLPPLKEVELFINKNGHLPGIPSAKEVERAGIDLGAMDAKLLQKIEELTLYVIELKKENEAMKKQIQELQVKEKNNTTTN